MTDFMKWFIELNKKSLSFIPQSPIPKRKVKVAMIDGSPFLKLCPWVTPVNYKTDRHYHATLHAYILKAVAPTIDLYAISVYRNPESTLSYSEALDWCITNDIEVISISMSWPTQDNTKKLLDLAIQKGIKIITSAGNTGENKTFPGTHPGVIPVGALDAKLNKIAQYSAEADILYPGSWWGFTLHDDLSRIKPLPQKGTSFASPAYAGEVANELGQHDIIRLRIGDKLYTINNKPMTMDTAPFIKDDRTFVPVRFVAEALGATVEWDESHREVIIKK